MTISEFFAGIDSADGMTVVIVWGLVYAACLLVARLVHRKLDKPKRIHDIERVAEMRRRLAGWEPPEQKHARPRWPN